MSDISYRISPSKSGTPTLSVNVEGREQFLHSRHDPSREGSLFRKELENLESDLVIVLGFGLGYHLKDNGDLFKNKKLISIDILFISQGEQERYGLVQPNDFTLLSGLSLEELSEKLQALIDLSKYKGISVLRHPASYRIFREYYTSCEELIQKVIDNGAANKITAGSFGPLYFKNGIKRLNHLKEYVSANCLFGHFKECHACVIASAPTAFAALDKVEEIGDHTVLIAVDSALPMLKARGIVPDFVVSVDPQPWITEHLFCGSFPETRLVVSLTAYNAIFEQKFLHSYLVLNSHPLSQLFDLLYKNTLPFVESKTKNVAGEALSLALHMGCKTVTLCGLDFSFPGYTIYGRATVYQDRYAKLFNNRFASAEFLNLRYIFENSKKMKLEEGLYSRRSFLNYRELFEKEFSHSKDRIFLMDTALSSDNFRPSAQMKKVTCDKKRVLAELDSLSLPLNINLTKFTDLILREDVLQELFESGQIDSPKVQNKLLTIINKMLISC